ncbi:hypothetical protein [Nodularia sp. NIES-3585]|uniref:hypothetical protein n=1 Tax=Nodularia sp. NIES-3585 TaxID=1973477 RepID=UPI000B5C8820|nr:hypothetical protein [Nodularia sp. NIES-3585]GAX36232.1 hypothetical protein NIES3585_22580 [Nodularia sp. NIES-3585]
MSETPFKESQNPDDQLLSEYHFDYQKTKPNRFAKSSETQDLTVAVLDENVAKVFKTPELVNQVLRALIESMLPTKKSETA